MLKKTEMSYFNLCKMSEERGENVPKQINRTQITLNSQIYTDLFY